MLCIYCSLHVYRCQKFIYIVYCLLQCLAGVYFGVLNLCNNVFQVIVEQGILPCLAQLLARNYPKIIKKQACLIVSNITAGSKDQIQVTSYMLILVFIQ